MASDSQRGFAVVDCMLPPLEQATRQVPSILQALLDLMHSQFYRTIGKGNFGETLATLGFCLPSREQWLP